MASRSGLVTSFVSAFKGRDEYSKVATEEDGQVLLHQRNPFEAATPDYRDIEHNESTGLLAETDDPEKQAEDDLEPITTRRKSRSWTCFGVRCSLIWKVIFAVFVVVAVLAGVKLYMWAVAPAAPSAVRAMPVFGKFLGCEDAEYVYSGHAPSFHVPIGVDGDHGMDVRSGGVGTIVLLEGAADATSIKYEVTLRANDRSLLEKVKMEHAADGGKPVKDSHYLLATQSPDYKTNQCLRYDVKMWIPPNLKRLHVASHGATTHVQFDPSSSVELDDFYVTLYTMSRNNLIIPHNNFRATKTLALEVFNGWIVGDVSVNKMTKVNTQRGRGVMNVRVHPTPAQDPSNPEPAAFHTTSGAGRTDIFYIDDQAVHRPIKNVHLSSMNADMYITYKDAHYNGRVKLSAKTYSETNLHILEESEPWTHYVGDAAGADEVSITSRGFVGLYY